MEKHTQNTIAVITFDQGHLDSSNYQQIKAQLHELLEGEQKVVLDLRNIDFLDSSGLSTLLSALRKIRTADGQINIVYSNSALEMVFDIVQLHRIISLHNTMEEAKQELAT